MELDKDVSSDTPQYFLTKLTQGKAEKDKSQKPL